MRSVTKLMVVSSNSLDAGFTIGACPPIMLDVACVGDSNHSSQKSWINFLRLEGQENYKQRSSVCSVSSMDRGMFCDDLILETPKMSQIAFV
jgi:hypothetical protein